MAEPPDQVGDTSEVFGLEMSAAALSPGPNVSPLDRESRSSFSISDFLMLVVGALIAEPLCHAGWDAVVSGEHIDRGIIAIVGGLVLGIPLGSFHWWKDRLSEGGLEWVRRNATWWAPLAVVLFFVYSVGPNIYHRAVAPFSPGAAAVSRPVPSSTPTSSKPDPRDAIIADLRAQLDAVTKGRGPLESQLATTQSQLQDAKRQLEIARQAVRQPPAPPPEDQVPISWQPDFQLNWDAQSRIIWVRFIGKATALAHIEDAYIISTLTGHKERLTVSNPVNQSESWDINQIEPVAAGAQIILHRFASPLPISEFQNQWGAFELHLVYDGKQYARTYDRNLIADIMARAL